MSVTRVFGLPILFVRGDGVGEESNKGWLIWPYRLCLHFAKSLTLILSL
jgi:hypothetical protein